MKKYAIEKVKKVFTILLILCFASCNQKEITKNDLQGDWTDGIFLLSFYGDKASVFNHENPFSEYKIKKDTIWIKEAVTFLSGKVNEGKDWYKFKVNKLEKDSLSLFIIYEEEGKQLISDLLHLHKIKKKNNKELKSVSLHTYPCYGFCPILKIELNKNEISFFEGRRNVLKKGSFECMLTQAEFKFYAEKAQHIDWANLKENYEVGYTDASGFSFQAEFEDGSLYKTYVYGNDAEPKELRAFVHYLSESQVDNKWQKVINKHDFKPVFHPLKVDTIQISMDELESIDLDLEE